MVDEADLNLSDNTLSELAGEIVRDIYPVEVLLKRYNIPPSVFHERIKTNRRFMAMLAEAAIAWDSSLNIKARIELKGEAMVEAMMLKGYEYFNDARYPLSDKVKLFQTVARIAGLYEQTNPTGLPVVGGSHPSDRVNITINLHPHAHHQGGQAGNDPQTVGAIVIDQPAPALPASDPIDQ